MDRLMDFLLFALPGGFIGSIFTWLFGRRKRDNDMLSQLQASINMLSEENRKILQENVQLRRENADLKANQEEMIIRLTKLTKEVERLRKVINKNTGNDEKQNSRDSPRINTTNSKHGMPVGMRNGEDSPGQTVLPANRSGEKRKSGLSGRNPIGQDITQDKGSIAGIDTNSPDKGNDPGVTGESESADSEPP